MLLCSCVCNIARTNRVASGLTVNFWARVIFYAADTSILGIQYRTIFKESSHPNLFGSQLDVTACNAACIQPACNAGCMFDHWSRQASGFDAWEKPAILDTFINCGLLAMESWTTSLIMSYSLYSLPTSVSTNNKVVATVW